MEYYVGGTKFQVTFGESGLRPSRHRTQVSQHSFGDSKFDVAEGHHPAATSVSLGSKHRKTTPGEVARYVGLHHHAKGTKGFQGLRALQDYEATVPATTSVQRVREASASSAS